MDIEQVIQKLVHALEHPSRSVRVYTIQETADILKCKERAIKHYLYEAKDLRYLKVGREVRIREEDLREFLTNHLTPCIYDQEILP